MIKKYHIFAIFLLFLVPIVLGQEDFGITAEPTLDVCPCSGQGYVIYIENKQNTVESYSVTFSGGAGEWARAQPAKFSINPGLTSYFYVFINSDCNIIGNYDLNVHITDGKVVKTLKQILNFGDCYKSSIEIGELVPIKEDLTQLEFAIQTDEYNICQEDDSKFMPILLKNLESYENIYNLELRGPQWAVLDVNRVKLAGNGQGIVLIRVNTTDIKVNEFNFILNMKTELGNVKSSKDIPINVNNCYDIEIDIEEVDDVVCENKDSSYDIKVSNKGFLSANVNLEPNVDWVIINGSVTVGSKRSNTIKMFVRPPEELVGLNEVFVNAYIANTDVNVSDSIEINFVSGEECYDLDIDVPTTVKNNYDEQYYSIDVINNGLKSGTFIVSLDGPSWVSVSPKKLEIEPEKKGNVNLYINPSEYHEEGSYDFVLIFREGDNEITKDFSIKLKKGNMVINNLVDTIVYYQYYIYIGLILLILLLLLIKPLKSYFHGDSYKEKVKKDKSKGRVQEKKEIKKSKRIVTAKKKKETKDIPFMKIISLFVVIVVLVVLGFIFRDELVDLFGDYLYYVLAAIVVLLVLVLLLKKKRKPKKKKKPEKRPLFKTLLGIILLVVIVVAGYFFYSEIREFVIIYWGYIIFGFVFLAIIIIILKFKKKVEDFFKD